MTDTATTQTGVPAGTGSSTDRDGSAEGGGARAVAHDATDQARHMAATGKEEATKVLSEVRSQASTLVGEAGHRARDRAESQVGNAAQMLGDMSDELDRMAASSMSDSPLTTVARDGATFMRTVSRRLQDGGLDAAMTDVRGFARRQPVMFLGGAFAVGLLAGRLVRNTDVGALKQQVQQLDDQPDATGTAGMIDTGTTSRVENGMAPALDDALAAEAGMPLGSSTGFGGSTDLAAGVDADWDAPSLQESGSQAGSGRRP